MAPKIYHLHPLVAGPVRAWPEAFARVRAMGFDTVCLAPPFLPGERGDIFITRDHDRLHPALEWDGSADSAMEAAAAAAARAELRLMLDIAVDPIASGAGLRREHPGWYSIGGSGGTPDPRRTPRRLDAGYGRFDHTDAAEGIAEWWIGRLTRLANAGLRGFRCLAPGQVPRPVWRRIVSAVKAVDPDSCLLAWTPGLTRDAVAGLEGAGFDLTCASTPWWDGRSVWLAEEMEALWRVAPALASPEPSFTDRLASHLPADQDPGAAYRRAMRIAAAAGQGVFVPMGFEYASRRPFDTALASRDDMDIARAMAPVDLSEDIVQANALLDRITALGVDSPLRMLTESPDTVTAWLRTNTADARTAGTAILIWINVDLARSAAPPFPPDVLPPSAGAAFGFAASVETPDDPAAPLAPGEVRVLSYRRQSEIHAAAEPSAPRKETAAATRIAVEAVAPAAPDGDFPAKTVVGEAMEVSADIYADGHETLAADVLWRAADETVWQREPMRKGLNDRWTAVIRPARIGRHLFTVEAWWDQWGTFRHDLEVKHAASQALGLEIEEGRQHIRAAIERASGAGLDLLRSLLDRLEAADEATQVALLLSDDALAAMQAVDAHSFHNRHAPPLPLWVDRPQAVFASWYEMFPRSAASDPDRHGTFRDVIARLPAIRAMGFDVLYFPPIHPIGSVNRKGRNNALRAEPGDVGSPYAIGSADGGHDAVHPQLGTIEDFDALVAAARDHGLELALDFAIQCAPDHPWISQHPDWFRWRPDGSMRYAENPPKKYEDIVNPDFYAEAAMPDLWFALRDVIRFWIGHGVRIFRVDNPHTKPLPFWRWMIADIQAQFPDVLFLSEAFTRPKVMYRLAKVGFTQSYTYFTWRNTKEELTEYLTELSTPPVCDFFRPNFFVNTPDINPVYLQTSGRPGFLVRAALATTLSGLWGMYSGFEICESAPLPGREEYLDSEKYQIRVRDWHAPGNIVAEITALNRIRRAHPALQTHKGVTFYPAANDQILFYGKQLPGGHEIVLVAVNLDPHYPQEAAIEIPLWKLGLPDHAAIEATDLMRETRFTWHGKWQTVRLDPADTPFAIWRLSAPGAA